MDRLEALLILNSVRGFDAHRLEAYLEELGSLEAILACSERFRKAREEFPLAQELKLVKRQGIKLVSCFDSEYPVRLKEISSPPILLYAKGVLRKEEIAVGMVGSRNPSHYGAQLAKRWAQELTRYGVVVVSGMARGIDSMAHEGVLLERGRTLAVLGGGLGNIYPAENQRLADQIAENGAVVSEFPMQAPPLADHFPQRNRIISGLSLGVIVVEAGERSGALITAGTALEQGREVFAIPGRIDSPTSIGPHRLIQQGAKLVTSVREVLEELAIPILCQGDFGSRTEPSPRFAASAPEDQKILKLLSSQPMGLDELTLLSGLGIQELSSQLSRLSIEGKLIQLPGPYFALP